MWFGVGIDPNITLTEPRPHFYFQSDNRSAGGVYRPRAALFPNSTMSPLTPPVSPSVGLIRCVVLRVFMGDCDKEPVTIRGRMDDRGRITIKEDDRIALGVDDLEEGERALLEMKTIVVKRVKGDSSD